MKMAENQNALESAGLHFDEMNKVRVLDPDVSEQTGDLRDECQNFVDKMNEFQRLSGSFITTIDDVAKEVDAEKIKAIGARNQLKSISKQREAQQQQLHSLIAERRKQLERLRIEHESLQKVEAEQNDFIEQFTLQK